MKENLNLFPYCFQPLQFSNIYTNLMLAKQNIKKNVQQNCISLRGFSIKKKHLNSLCPKFIILDFLCIELVILLCSDSILGNASDGLSHHQWRHATIDKMCALQRICAWNLIPLPLSKIVVGCYWIFTMEVYLMLKLIHSRPIWFPLATHRSST
jgi:hypothetical protein